MSAALVGTPTEIKNDSGASASASIGSPSAGDALLWAGTMFSGSSQTAVITNGGTWTTDHNFARDGGTGYSQSFASCPSATGGATSVTVTWNGGSGFSSFVMEFSGMASPILDAVGTQHTGTSASQATSSQTNSNASDVMIAVVSNDDGVTGSFSSPTNGWTIAASEVHGATSVVMSVAYLIVSASAAQSTTLTYSSSRTYVSAIAAYKQSAGGGGGFTAKARRTLHQFGDRVGSRAMAVA